MNLLLLLIVLNVFLDLSRSIENNPSFINRIIDDFPALECPKNNKFVFCIYLFFRTSC